MGQVFRAYDKEVGEEVALKLLHPEIALSKRTVDRFRNEIKLARKITHRNVCRMHELHQDGQTLFITMEYVTGQDLKGLIKQTGALTTGKTISIARQVAEGLAEAHSSGGRPPGPEAAEHHGGQRGQCQGDGLRHRPVARGSGDDGGRDP